MMSLLDFENHANTCFRIVRDLFKNLSSVLTAVSFCADTQTQLENRASNAALMRYVDSMRTHGHRAARIDPLDLIQREDVAALSPARYGLVDEEKKYNVNGILWRRARKLGEEEDWLSLRDITEHLRKVYVGNIAYEVRFWPSYLLLCFALTMIIRSVYALSFEDRASLVFSPS
jgi:2-oxoglutarate dehydrogenase complex dehydrogenase (E1) component-like enzyme